jgi:hypothetical protein
MQNDHHIIIAKFEAEGESNVRFNLAHKKYNDIKAQLAKDWLDSLVNYVNLNLKLSVKHEKRKLYL